MRIGIYTFFLTPGQIGGIETYLRQLIAALGQVDKVNEYTLFVGEHNQTIFQDITYPNFKQVTISIPPTFYAWSSRILRRLRVISNPITRQLQAHRLDLLHYPGTTIDQLEIEIPCVLTMHDIQHEVYPEFFSGRELARRRRAYQPSARKARHIITDSEFTKNSLIEKYHIPPQKITTIHFGVNPAFQAHLDPAWVSQIRDHYHLPQQFIYFPANLWPHKNHRRLFEALKLVRQKYGHQACHLVLSGIFALQQEALQALINEYGLQEATLVLGYLPFADLAGIYAAATALIFPSLFEGFGLPVLEAMACGCPVICANTTSLPEVAGPAAVFIDPRNVDEMAEAIHAVLDNHTLRASLKTQGLARAKQFSWQKAAQETIKVYQSIL